MRTFIQPYRRVHQALTLPLRHPLKPLLPALRLTTGTAVLSLTQSLLGHRWNPFQLLIALSSLNLPFFNLLRPLRIPLIATWVYGIAARLLAPAHRRSLKFWKRVLPVYIGYKRTQIELRVRGAEGQQRSKAWNKRHDWGAEKVYNLCVELRGFYLKDGQFLGARSDLVPPAWCDTLRRLQDRVPPIPFHRIEKTVREEYRINKLSQVFRTIDPNPLASATIAQVHRGEMPDGTSIALKTQYDDQEHLCNMDLLNLKRLARYLQKHDMSFFDMDSVVEEFESQIPAEFDFLREAVMMTTIRQNLKKAGIHDVVIPRVLPGLVSRRALTMTFIDGCRPDNAVALNLWGIKPKDVVKAVGRAYGQMLLVDGVAHCDPHFGNRKLCNVEPFWLTANDAIHGPTNRLCDLKYPNHLVIILRDKRVALIDFGQSKEIPEDLRQKLCAFYLAINSGNNLFIMKTFGDLGIELDIRPEDIDEEFIEMIPNYANGLLDTAPLPPEIEINPFSTESPLKKVPIKKFNPDLFMVLRTMGLLRSLTVTLNVSTMDCWMSSIFKPYAMRGMRMKGPTEGEKRKRYETIRSTLTTGVSSPFESQDVERSDYCPVQ